MRRSWAIRLRVAGCGGQALGGRLGAPVAADQAPRRAEAEGPLVAVDRAVVEVALQARVGRVGHHRHGRVQQRVPPVVVIGGHSVGGHHHAPSRHRVQRPRHRLAQLGRLRSEARSRATGRRRPAHQSARLGHPHRVVVAQPHQLGALLEARRGHRRPPGHLDCALPQRPGPCAPQQSVPAAGLDAGRVGVFALDRRGVQRGRTEHRHHRLRSRLQQPARLVQRQHRPLGRLRGRLRAAEARGPGAEPATPNGPADRVLDRAPARGPAVERLGHAVDVAGPPAPPGDLVGVAALVVGVPAGQRGVLQRDPHPQALGRRRVDDVEVAIESIAVGPPCRGLDPGPFHRQPQAVEPQPGQLRQVVTEVPGEPGAVARPRRPPVPLPHRPVGRGRHPLSRHRRCPRPPQEPLVPAGHGHGLIISPRRRGTSTRAPQTQPQENLGSKMCGISGSSNRDFRHTPDAPKRPRG